MSDATQATDGVPNSAQSAPPPPPPKDASPPPPTGDGGGAGKGVKGTGGGSLRATRSIAAVFILVALTFVVILASLFWPYFFVSPSNLDRTLLQALSHTETARGLITFLVAVSTVGIALILIVYLASSDAEVEVIKERFGFSKEVLTSLIGILGTIIGFYFGATQDQTHGHATPTTLTLANLDITPPRLGKDGTVQAILFGGQSPYTYEIRLTQDTKTIKRFDGPAPNGTINQPIKFDDYDPAKPLDITLEGTDATGAISGKQLHLLATPGPSTQIPSANKTH